MRRSETDNDDIAALDGLVRSFEPPGIGLDGLRLAAMLDHHLEPNDFETGGSGLYRCLARPNVNLAFSGDPLCLHIGTVETGLYWREIHPPEP